ncbi:hypothetical protein [Aquimarina addita]
MNSIKFSSLITTIGSVGKLLFCLLFIGAVILLVNKEKIKIEFIRRKESIIIFSLLLIFATCYILLTGSRTNMLPNLAFPVYFLFYYFLVKLILRSIEINNKWDLSKVIQFRILSVFRKALYINFFFWFAIAIVGRIPMFEESGGFGGFFQDEIHFGFFVVTGFLISLYFRYNDTIRDTSYFNLILLFMYGGMALFTSRNAFLIILVAVFYYFIISKIKNKFYRVFLFTIVIIGVNVNFLFQDISEKEIIEITSGRYSIWVLAFEEMFARGFLILGNGLFNLNDIILKQNQGIGLYYLDSLNSLSFHNSYVELVAGGGVIIIFFFIKIILKTWKSLTTINRSIVASILVGATFESFLVQPFMLIACLFYFIIIINNTTVRVRIKKDSKENKNRISTIIQ